jgi:hypothetical protein
MVERQDNTSDIQYSMSKDASVVLATHTHLLLQPWANPAALDVGLVLLRTEERGIFA